MRISGPERPELALVRSFILHTRNTSIKITQFLLRAKCNQACPVLGVCVGFLSAAAMIGVFLARVMGLPFGSARTLMFSLLGNRNCFTVLSLALGLAS